MASSENQGLQIALIIFVVLTIMLSVTTFLFFRQADQYSAQAKTEQETANKAETGLRTKQQEFESLSKIAGFPQGDAMESMNTTFEADKQKYMGTFQEQNKNYRDAMMQLYTSLQSTQASLLQEQAKSANLESQMQQNLAAHTAEVTQLKKSLADKQTELDTELVKAQTDRETKDKTIAERDAQIAQLRTEKDQIASTSRAELQDKQTKLDEVADALQLSQTRATTLSRELFEPGDGQIVRIDQRSRVVWINRGSADGLRRQSKFSVWDANTQRMDLTPPDTTGKNVTLSKNQRGSNAVSENPNYKGAIEITKILGAKLAVGRILEDNLADPIVQGDQIFSPVWDAGSPVHFALAGVMDIDGDGRDDSDLVRHAILSGGGIIDAEDTDEEDRPLSVNVRYLVRGAAPKDAEQAREDRWNRMLKESQALGIESISFNELLDFLGREDFDRVVGFGSKTASKDVPLEDPDGSIPVSRGAVSGLYSSPKGTGVFRPRRPPSSPAGSAFAKPNSPPAAEDDDPTAEDEMGDEEPMEGEDTMEGEEPMDGDAPEADEPF